MTESRTCEDFRLAAMAERDAETSPLRADEVQSHLATCEDCRRAVAAVDIAPVLNGFRRDSEAIDVWPNISHQLIVEASGKSPGAERRRLWSSTRPVLAAAAVVLACGIGLVPWLIPETDIRTAREPVAASATTPAPYVIGYAPPRPVSRKEYLAKYAPLFENGSPPRPAPDGGFGKPGDRDAPGAAREEDLWIPVDIHDEGDGRLGNLYFDPQGAVALAVRQPWAQPFSEGLAVVATRIDVEHGLRLTDYGYIDRRGELVIPGRFEYALSFSEGLAAVQIGGKYGFIDRTGRTVIPPQFVLAEPFTDGMARVQPDHNTVTFIDRTGQQLFTAADVGRFSEGLLYVNAPATEVGRSYVDKQFQPVVRIPDPMPSPHRPGGFTPLRCDEFHEKLAAIEGVTGKGNSWGYLSTDGTLAIAGPFEQATPFSEGLAAVSIRAEPPEPLSKWGYIDRTGAFVVPPQFLFAQPFHDGLAAVLVVDESVPGPPPTARWGYIDPTGRIVIEPQFYDAGHFHKGRASVREHPDNRAAIDRSGKRIWRVDGPTQ